MRPRWDGFRGLAGEAVTSVEVMNHERDSRDPDLVTTGDSKTDTIVALDPAPSSSRSIDQLLQDFLDARPCPRKDGRVRPLQETFKGGRYRVLGVLKEGGMSSIFQVWDRDFARKLGLKILVGSEAGGTPSDEAILRFLSEALITANLEHPSVVPVYDIGFSEDGFPFFTMQQVIGRNLTEIFDLANRELKGWTLRSVLGALHRACQAISYAHAKGVVHRDLKPDNIMVGQFGEVYVMDWGLAKQLRRDSAHAPEGLLRDLGRQANRSGAGSEPEMSESREIAPLRTVDGTVFGTPVYMSPEQAAGRVRDIGTRSDVYALGAILYTLIGKQHPFSDRPRSRGMVQLLETIANESPVALRDLTSGVPGGLIDICERAMARDPEDRYPSASALAEALESYLQGSSLN